MSNPTPPHTPLRSRLMAAAAAVVLTGAAGFAVVSDTAPVLADPVYVKTTQAMPSFADVVEQVSPAVVSVLVKSRVEPAGTDGTQFFFGGPGFDQLPDDSPLKRFFKEFRDQQEHRRHHNDDGGKLRPTAQGSGFFISEDGYLVTNNHVVKGGGAFSVRMDDGTEYDAKLVGTDPRTDLAVLKVDGKGKKFTYVQWADDSKVRVGDWVVAVGNPFGLGGTVTAGIVSARGRDIGAGPYDDFIQIDAAVNHGNSGGPAFNMNGEVVGINTAIFSPSGGNVGIAFAIPASTAKGVVQELIKKGEVDRGWLGVQIQPVTKDIAESLGRSDEKGALVAEAQDNSPAKAAGIKAGDVITAVDGKTVDSPKELARVIGEANPGKSVEVQVWRNGSEKTFDVKLGEMPAPDKMASADDSSQPDHSNSADTLDKFGLTVAPSDKGKGLVVTDVDPNSDAADRGIQAGDVIVAVNSKDVNSASDVDQAASEAAKAGRKAVLLQIMHDDNSRFVALPVAKG
ncbi:MAG: Do family serine endopeptidase [Rhizobiaceae bacterium]